MSLVRERQDVRTRSFKKVEAADQPPAKRVALRSTQRMKAVDVAIAWVEYHLSKDQRRRNSRRHHESSLVGENVGTTRSLLCRVVVNNAKSL